MGTDKKTKSLAIQAHEYFNSRTDTLKKWCKGELTPLQLASFAELIVREEPKFHDPSVWPSLYLALITSAQLGLEPSGPFGEAHILPYWDSKAKRNLAQFQPGYRGLLKLMAQSGITVRSYVVYENDSFAIKLGSEPEVYHKLCLGDRGKPIGAYSIATMSDGTKDYEWAAQEDIDRAKKNTPAWNTWPEQMARKFVIKRHSNQLPLNPKARRAVILDNQDVPAEIDSSGNVTPIIDVQSTQKLPAKKEGKRTIADLAKTAQKAKPETVKSKSSDKKKSSDKEEAIEPACELCCENPAGKDNKGLCDGCAAAVEENEKDL